MVDDMTNRADPVFEPAPLCLAQFGNQLPAIRLQGLKPDGFYKVEPRAFAGKWPMAAQTLSGAALMERGLTLRLKGDLASALIRIEAAP